jgi:hypothetical protein
MGAKNWASEIKNVKLTYDYAVHGGSVGTINLGNLPDNFVITKVVAVAETALTGGGTLVVGEDGGGDADGYFTDLDAIAVATPVAGTGALVFDPPATDAADIGNEKMHKVDSAKDGVLITIATTGYTAGKIHFNFIGFQSH